MLLQDQEPTQEPLESLHFSATKLTVDFSGVNREYVNQETTTASQETANRRQSEAG